MPTYMQWNPPILLPQFPLASAAEFEPIDKKQIELDRPVIAREELFALLERHVLPMKVIQKNDYVDFIFGQGLPLYTYLAESKSLLDSLNCPIVDGQEIKDHTLLEVEFTCSSQWTGILRLSQSKSSHQLFSQIAVVFKMDSALDISLLNTLHHTKFPYSLLINPFRMQKGAQYDIDRLYNKEILIHMPMEPTGYPFKNPGKQTLLINYNNAQIQSRVEKALKKLNRAKGLAPYYGDRASQHPSLMIDLFEYLFDKKLSYLDLHSDGREERRNWCHQAGIECPMALEYDPKKSKLSEHIDRIAGNAKKNGRNILLLQADTNAIREIEHRLEGWTDEGLELVLYSEIAETEKTP